VLNLLSNAVRHSPGGTTTTLSLACEGKEFICTVADPGCGIAAGGFATVISAISAAWSA
jgi:signal transduction histidine kinase